MVHHRAPRAQGHRRGLRRQLLPAHKGFSFANGLDENAERAFASAFWMGIAGFTGWFAFADPIAAFFGAASCASADFVVFATVVVHLSADLCPAINSPLGAI